MNGSKIQKSKNMKKKIVVQHGENTAIAKILGCTHEYVCHALAYRKDSVLARKIRKVAMERGGVEVVIPEVARQRVV